jgi:hypothetical protein
MLVSGKFRLPDQKGIYVLDGRRMMALPARQTAIPIKSHRSGRCPSAIQSQVSEAQI